MTAQATVLYDAPGPRARARSRVISVVGVLVLAALIAWVIYRLSIPQVAANGNETAPILDPTRWDALQDGRVWKLILDGALATLAAAAVGMVGALVFAVLLAFGRLASSPIIRVPVTVLLEFFRGMPVLLMMLFILLVASTGAFWAVVIALVVYNGSILGEALRAGILTQMLPIIMAQLVVLLKDTSLGYIVGYQELLAAVKNLSNFFGSYYAFTFWFVGALVYIAINLAVSWLGRRAARSVAAKRA